MKGLSMRCTSYLRRKTAVRVLSMIALSLFLFAGCGKKAPVGTEILWDSYGIPHIFAENSERLHYAFGWAQARNHGDLILRLYGEARGRASEYWGEENLRSDWWVHVNGIPDRARDWYEKQNPGYKKYLDAFAEGINAYAAANTDRISDEVEIVLPVTPVDVLAHCHRVITFFFVTNPQAVSNAASSLDKKGSNAWAVGPSRSASGNALLMGNPHLPWHGYFLFTEAQLVSPDIDAYGVTLVGMPSLGIAFNDNLGWSHTVNVLDGFDLYELKLAGGGYMWDGSVKAFETDTVTLKIKRKDGTLTEEPLPVRRSIHGPVVIEKKGKSALALRVAGLDRYGIGEEWWDMSRAKNLDEFTSAIRRLQIPIFTMMYADRDGHIMHFFGGAVPRRPSGDWNWAGVVPGDVSQTLWSDIHTFEELPRIIDPPTGWLQNANDPPWTTTYPPVIDAGDYPSYMSPRFMHFRAQRSSKLLMEDESITLDELIRYKHSTRVETADRLLDDLLPVAREYGDDIIKQAVAVLEKWDRNVNAESRGAVLFEAFFNELGRRRWKTGSPFAKKWSESDPINTPDGLSDPDSAITSLALAMMQLKSHHMEPDISWGEVNRFKIGDVNLPANGGSAALGIFRNISFEPDEGTTRKATGGDSFVFAVEFGGTLRAKAVLSYGNASQPGSPHMSDQLKFLSAKELREVWRDRNDIEAHLEEREEF